MTLRIQVIVFTSKKIVLKGIRGSIVATDKKPAKPKKVEASPAKVASLKQTSIFLLSGITAVILLALVTYNPADPGLFHLDRNAVVQNKAGAAGAYLADVLMGFLGYLSYLIPIAFIVSALLLFRSKDNKKNNINLGITVFGVFLALFSGCGLATLLWPESNLSHTSGGLLGHGIARMFVHLLDDIGATMILFTGFIAGITLFADIQWIKLVDKIGELVLAGIEFFTGDDSDTSKKSAKPQKSAAKDKSSKTSSTSDTDSTSMLGALTAAITGLFFWNKTKDVGLSSGLQEPRTDLLDEIINNQPLDNKGTVLGVPDYINKDTVSSDATSKNNKGDNTGNNQGSKKGDKITAVKEAVTKLVKSKEPKSEAKSTSKNIKPKKAKQLSLSKVINLPPISLLNPPPPNQGNYSTEKMETHGKNIVEALEHFGVRGVEIDSYYPGPIITRFELQLPPGTKVSKITGLAQDMARNMCVSSIRVVEIIPGKTTIGIEVPNEERDLVSIKEILDSSLFKESPSPLTMVLGKTIEGNPSIADLSRMPHLLIAGTTGSGKSVGVNAMLISLLYKATPDEVKLILIDPKMLELSIYEGVPHLLTPVVTDMKDASNALRWAVGEMERRYALMSFMKVRGIAAYNEKVKAAIAKGEPITDPGFDPTLHIDVQPSILEPLPFIVIVIDEFADMIMVVGKKVEELIARLAQKARAAGIHLILATQRPSVDVITGLIKANIPTRIAFQVSTKIDSRTILDQGGAESLLGHGDMLFLPPGTGLPVRVHGAFVADSEVEDVVNYLKLQGEPEYITDVIDDTGSSGAIPGLEPLADSETDALYDQAVAIVTESRRASISYVQRRLKVGYNRAASMIEDMEKAGVVSAVQSNGTREVLAPEPVKD